MGGHKRVDRITGKSKSNYNKYYNEYLNVKVTKNYNKKPEKVSIR